MAGSGGRPWRATGSVVVMLLGAAVYALVEGAGGVTFYITPAFAGGVAILAGLVGPVRRLIGSGLGLAGWGTAVLLVHYHSVPSARTTPAYMIGVAVGVVASRIVAPRAVSAQWMTAAAVAAGLGALGFYFEFDHAWLGRWPAWAVTVAVWGLYLGLVSAFRDRTRRDAGNPASVPAASTGPTA